MTRDVLPGRVLPVGAELAVARQIEDLLELRFRELNRLSDPDDPAQFSPEARAYVKNAHRELAQFLAAGLVGALSEERTRKLEELAGG